MVVGGDIMDSNENDFNQEDEYELEEQEELLEEEIEPQVNNYNEPVRNNIGNRYINNKLNKVMNGYEPAKFNKNTTDLSNGYKKNNTLSDSNKVSNENKIKEAKKVLDAVQKADEEGKNRAVAAGKAIAKEKVKKKLLAFVISNLPIIFLFIFILLILIILITIISIFVAEHKSSDIGREYGCSSISMTETSLSKSEFIEIVNSSNVINTFKVNAGKIYDIAKTNKINPELVVIRAKLEGYSPGDNNNYWGIRCYNNAGKSACQSFSTFDQGVFEYVKNISRYGTLQEMLGKYANIGANWYNPGSSSNGGCYYFPYIKQYMSEARAKQVEVFCQPERRCTLKSCVPTTDEDQEAYTMWQVQRMIEVRQEIFNLGEDECDDEYPDAEIEDDGTLGSQVANYAIETFDSYSYSQDTELRWSNRFVDCSSMVYRAYANFGYKFGGNSTASTEFVWCKDNNKLIKESELKAGDLIFFNKGSHHASGKAYGIGHVTMYIGNDKQFSARTSRYAQPEQVAVTTYSKNSGSYFCRPYK